MLNSTVILFVLAAVTGLMILIKWLTKKEASRAVVYTHGLFAAAGLSMLSYYSIQHPKHFPKTSLILFLTAALAGFYMFFQDLRKKSSPVALALIHALIAVTAFTLLLAFVFF